MKPVSFRSLAAEISLGRLDAIEPEVRMREVNQALKKSSWFELVGTLVVIVVIAVFAIAFIRAIAAGHDEPSAMPIAAVSSTFLLLVTLERKGRDRVRREFIARYEDNSKNA
jgi:O-antigen/teichoic acid export membrane protein